MGDNWHEQGYQVPELLPFLVQFTKVTPLEVVLIAYMVPG